MLLYHKSEAVAPSYTRGTLGNLLVKYNTVRQFWGGPPTKNGPKAKNMRSKHPNRVYLCKK